MPPDNGGRTDASDVLIALFTKWYVWAVLALGLIVLSGWADPEAVTEFFERTFKAWRCAP